MLSQGTVEFPGCDNYLTQMNKFLLSDTDGFEEKASEGPLVSIVDDDVSARRFSQRLLNSSGLLADVSMPEMNGLSLQRHLAQTGRMIRATSPRW
jgi:DNA-binding NarL/FixJ family response regulator